MGGICSTLFLRWRWGLRSMSIVIDRGKTGGYALRITNERGTVIETAVSESIAEFSTTALQEIYELARRQALRVNETLLDIKKTLERL
jgi:hypothetical protein